MNEFNLIPFKQGEDARSNGQKGGQKSGQARRKRKAMAEQMNTLLSLPVASCEHNMFLEQMGIDYEDADNQMLMLTSVFVKACEGNLDAFKEIKGVVEGMNNNTNAKQEQPSNLADVIQQAYENQREDNNVND